MTEPQKPSLEGLSFSALSDLKKSARKFWRRRIDPNRPPKVETDAMVFGKLFHVLTLQPHLFDEQFAVKISGEEYPDALDTVEQLKAVCKHVGITIGTKKKAELESAIRDAHPEYTILSDILAEWSKKHEGKMLISKSDKDSGLELADDVKSHPHARRFLTMQKAHFEQKVEWTNGFGIPMRGIIDVLGYLPEDQAIVTTKGTKIFGNCLVELKSYSNPYEKTIDKSVSDKFANELQFLQLGIYKEAAKVKYNVDVDWFITIYAESGVDRHIIIRANKSDALPITQGEMLYDELCRRFLMYHERFGFEQPWIDDAQLTREFEDEEFPIWVYN